MTQYILRPEVEIKKQSKGYDEITQEPQYYRYEFYYPGGWGYGEEELDTWLEKKNDFLEKLTKLGEV